MTTRNAVGFELRLSCPTGLRLPPSCQRTFRHVTKERPLSRRGYRFVLNRPVLLPSSRASMDSTDTDLVPDTDVVEQTSAETPSEDSDSSPEEASDDSSALEASEEDDLLPLPPRKSLAECRVGDVLEARVKHVISYGCFLDAICECDVFVHVSDLTTAFVEDTAKLLKIGDKVKVELIEVNDRLKGSLKNHNDFGQKVKKQQPQRTRRPERKERSPSGFFDGFIAKLSPDGAVVTFDDGKASGFLPVNEMVKPDDVDSEDIQLTDMLTKDDGIRVRVLEMDRATKRTILTMQPLVETEVDEIDTEFEEEDQKGEYFFDDGGSGEDAILKAVLKKAGFVQAMFADPEKEGATDLQTANGIEPVSQATTELLKTEKTEESPELVTEEDALTREEEPKIVDGVPGVTEEAIEQTEMKPSESDAEAVAEDVPDQTESVLQTEAEQKLETTEEPEDTESSIPSVSEEVAEPSMSEVEEETADAVDVQDATVTADPSVAEETLEQSITAEEAAAAEEESAANIVASIAEEIPKQAEFKPETEPVNDAKTTSEDTEEVTEQPETVAATEEAAVVKPESTDAEDQIPGTPPSPEEEIPAADLTDVEEKAVQAAVPEQPAEESTPPMRISASVVKDLREMSGAGMMDCKKALTECNGDMNAAVQYLKNKGIASAAKRAGKIAADGVIATYIHAGAKLGILLEVNSETDFVARTDAFKEFVDDVALSIAASPDAICISPDDYPSDLLAKEKEVEMGREEIASKPEGIREKIVAGRLEKIKKTASVLEQPFIRDQTTTIQTALTEIAASLGEKISIRRFERYELGEGLEKKEADFAAEVADQIESKKAEAMTTKPEPEAAPEASDAEMKPVVKVAASLVKELREMTGGGLMDCKNALLQCDGDLEQAAEYLRKKGLAGAAKKAGRLASEGVICSYIHLGSRLGVMAEINCETDFVARGDEFRQLADDIAVQIAACPEVEYITEEAVPKALFEAELQSEMEKEDIQSKDEHIRQKIAEGRVQKTVSSMCLLDQPFLKDTNKTTGDIIKEHIATLGENIKVRRFVRFNLGEGIEKKESDFATEVAEQMQKRD